MLSSIADKKVHTPLEGLRAGAWGGQMARQHGRLHTSFWGTTMLAPSDALGEAVITSS